MSVRRTAGLCVAGALAAAGLVVWWQRDRGYDPDFDTAVASPAYRGDGPRVLYDEAHHNLHTASAAYRPFVELLRHDGYAVEGLEGPGPLSAGTLAGAAVLVIVGAQGGNEAGDEPAFTEAEAAAIEGWVAGGGALLLVSDHWPFGTAVAPLASRFGVQMGCGLVEDAAHSEPGLGASHLVFARDGGLLREHPVVSGRRAAERVERVLTFTGQSLLGPEGATPFLALSDGAIEYPPTAPRIERDGGDLRVIMEYAEPVPAAGRAQGLAFEHGQGRVVVLGESGMLRAQRESGDRLVGMNHPGCDNRQLALNVMHWLSRAP